MRARVGVKTIRDGEEIELLELSFRNHDRELWRCLVLSEEPKRERYVFFKIGEELLSMNTDEERSRIIAEQGGK